MADFDDDDDDFGDLYADVEAQASSAISSVLDTTRLCVVEPEEGDKFYAVTPSAELGFTSELRKVGCVEEGGSMSGDGDLGRRELGWEENGDIGVNVVDDGSDSEDDLNIVLNDDDCKFLDCARKGGVGGGVGFGAGEGQKPDEYIVVLTNVNGLCKKSNQDDQLVEGLEQNHNIQIGNDRRNGVKVNPNQHYKYIRNHRPLFPSNMTPDGSTNVAAFPSMSTRCDWEDNRYSLQQGSASVQVSSTYAKDNATLGQSGYGFWLPRHRTILDINIDTFELKPWRYPGVDITDFFNFGFNEDGWKLYCNSLEHHRQQSSTRIPCYESFKFNQVYGAGSMHEKVFQEGWSKDPQIGRGRTASASKSYDGKGRQSELPKGRAIEVEDSSGERVPSMDMKCPNVWYSDVVIEIKVQDSAEEFSGLGNKELGHTDSKEQEKPENRDLDVDKQVHRCDSASGDDQYIRYWSIATALTFESLNSDDHGNGCLSNVDIHSHAKVDACTSAQIAETMEIEKTTNDEVCGDTCDAYPCLLEAALSLEDQSLSSPALSSIGSDSEVSKGCINSSRGNIDNSLKRPPSDSGIELWESVASDYNSPKRNGAKMNMGDSKGYYSRSRKPIRKERNNPSGRPCNVAEFKVRTENGDESIPMRDTEAFCERGNKSFYCHRQKEGQHKFDYDDKQNFSYRETELSRGYGSEFFTKDHFHAGYTNYPRRIVHQSFRDKMVRSHEQRNARLDGEDVKNDQLCGGRGFSIGDMSPVTYVKQRNIKRRRKTEKQQFQEEAGHGVILVQETHYVRHKYERHLQSSGRGSQNLGGRGRYRNIPPLDLGCSLSTDYGDEHWGISDHQLLSSHSYKESPIAVGRSRHNRPQKHAVYASRSTKISGRCWGQVCAEEGRESDWHMNYNKSHSVNRLHLGRGRYNCRSEVLHWSDDKIISRQQDSKLYAAEQLFLRSKNSGNRKICARSGTLIDEMLIDVVQLEQHKYGKKITEGNTVNYFSRSSNTKYTDKHEQMGQICRDSIDLVVGEGKLSRRYSAGSSPKDCGTSHKVETFSNPGRGREKWLDKFVMAEQNQDLEIEEGQIVTEEPQEENQRMFETLAKMEKRRARFNKPISQKKEADGIPIADFTEENKQQRPARKRRWGGK